MQVRTMRGWGGNALVQKWKLSAGGWWWRGDKGTVRQWAWHNRQHGIRVHNVYVNAQCLLNNLDPEKNEWWVVEQPHQLVAGYPWLWPTRLRSVGDLDPKDSDPFDSSFTGFPQVTHAGYPWRLGLVDKLGIRDLKMGVQSNPFVKLLLK